MENKYGTLMSRIRRLRKNNFPKREIPQYQFHQNMWFVDSIRSPARSSMSIISDHVDQHMICKPKWLSREVISLEHVFKDRQPKFGRVWKSL